MQARPGPRTGGGTITLPACHMRLLCRTVCRRMRARCLPNRWRVLHDYNTLSRTYTTFHGLCFSCGSCPLPSSARSQRGGEECGEQSQRRDADRDPLRRGREECRHLRTRSGMQQEGGVEWHDRCPSRRPRRHPPSYSAKPLSRRSILGLIQRRCFFASCSAAGRISVPHPWLW